jgi:hypothetical protein
VSAANKSGNDTAATRQACTYLRSLLGCHEYGEHLICRDRLSIHDCRRSTVSNSDRDCKRPKILTAQASANSLIIGKDNPSAVATLDGE